MKEVSGIYYFSDPTDALMAIQQLSPTGAQNMLMDLVWKAYNTKNRDRKLSPIQQVQQSYNTAILSSISTKKVDTTKDKE